MRSLLQPRMRGPLTRPAASFIIQNLTIFPFYKSVLYNTRYRRVVGILNDQGTSGGVTRLPDRAINLMKRGSR